MRRRTSMVLMRPPQNQGVMGLVTNGHMEVLEVGLGKMLTALVPSECLPGGTEVQGSQLHLPLPSPFCTVEKLGKVVALVEEEQSASLVGEAVVDTQVAEAVEEVEVVEASSN
jgi:hypothetical protein